MSTHFRFADCDERLKLDLENKETFETKTDIIVKPWDFTMFCNEGSNWENQELDLQSSYSKESYSPYKLEFPQYFGPD